MSFQWKTHHIQELRRLLSTGHSREEARRKMSAKFGEPFTRNQIIGAAERHKLKCSKPAEPKGFEL